MPATAAHQPVLAEGVPQSGTGWLHHPLTQAQVWMLLVSWACNTDVHEAAEGLWWMLLSAIREGEEFDQTRAT